MNVTCWGNPFLQVDLTSGQVDTISFDQNVLKKFLLGRGIGDWLLFNRVQPGKTEPLGPDNVLIFGSGILIGTNFPGAVRTSVVSLNVLTGGYGESSCAGHFATRLKQAGHDGLLVQGKSSTPVYLWISERGVEIRDASHLVGKTTFETSSMIQEELKGDDIATATIGPAGERLVRYALINCDNRYAGRCGMGAIMGSKNLKAIAVRGTGTVHALDEQLLKKTEKKVRKALASEKGLRNKALYGLGKDTEAYNEMGLLFTKNFQETDFDRVSEIGYERVKGYYKKILPCLTDCPVRCDRLVAIPDGEPYGGTTVSSLQATPAYNMAQLLVDDMPTVIKAFELCNGYGIDMHSWSNCIAWAIECYERKILSREDTDKLELRWGDGPLLLESIRRIAFREGSFGNLLAEGVARASKRIGRGAERYAMHQKGMEINDELRVDKGMAFGILTESRGAGHTLGAYFGSFDKEMTTDRAKKLYGTENAALAEVYEDKADLVVQTEQYGAIQDCLGICWFASHRAAPLLIEQYNMQTYADCIRDATGVSVSADELFVIAERILSLEKVINVLSGLTRDDEYPPQRFFEPIPKGLKAGMKLDRRSLEALFRRHALLHNWDPETGIPTRSTLEQLGLGEVADRLETD